MARKTRQHPLETKRNRASPPALSLQSERYSMSGNIGENLHRLLGAPNTDPVETAIRESLQNIADAALPGTGPEILIRVRRLSKPQFAALRRCVLRDLPEDPDSSKRFAFLEQRRPLVLEICDFGTKGLGGPTRADRVPRNSPTDFIDFVRNVGTPRDTVRGGGTYGFGKASLYGVSRCKTLLIDSLVATGESDARRMIGAHLGPSFSKLEGAEETHFTGRHWWGRSAEADFVEPTVGVDAANLAEAVGFPQRPKGRSGTSIMVLDFDWHGDDLLQAGETLARRVLWNFWPRMMDSTAPDQRFDVSIEVEGELVAVPAPEAVPSLALFCEAMDDIRRNDADVTPITCGKPKKHLGMLSIKKGLHTTRRLQMEGEGPLAEACCHIALMRPVELVVKYLKGSPLANSKLEWAGVFLTSDDGEVERAFADAEPPTHDDWIPASMERGHRRTFVNVAMRKLQRHATEVALGGQSQIETNPPGPPLARLAGQLGRILGGAGGDGGSPRQPPNTRRSTRPRAARVSEPEFVRLAVEGQSRIAVFEVTVRQDHGRSGVRLHASAAIAIDGSAASVEDVDGILQPSVLRILGPESLGAEGAELAIAGAEGDFEIFVTMPSDAAIVTTARLLTQDQA